MIGTIPVEGSLSMSDLANWLSRNEQLGLAQLTALGADSGQNPSRTLATFIAYNGNSQLGQLAIVAAGVGSAGTKILSATVYVSGALTGVDVYRL